MLSCSKILAGSPAAACALFVGASALADENGVVKTSPYPCEENTVSTIIEVCKAVKTYLPFIECPTTTSICVKARQEIFTGLTGEVASPSNIKSWNGQGVSGQVFQGVGLCLMRDLSAAPMQTHAEASLPIGAIAVDSVVDYRSFDPVKGVFKGVHRLTAHAPAIGDVDLVTQEFTATAVNSNLSGQGKKVGDYAVTGAHALEFEADGGAESFDYELDAITIVTPYGTVTPKPHLSLSRSTFWSLSPYGGASTLTMNPGAFETTDVYGRLKGQGAASAIKPWGFKQGKYPGAKRCEAFAADWGCVWPTPGAWDSQVMLGARNVDPRPSGAAWKAPVGTPFPLRPDAFVTVARGDNEKFPNGFASAGVKIEYNLLGILPPAILNNGFIKPTVKMFVDPNIAVGYASQFDFWNAQASVWNPVLDPGPPAAMGTPEDVESFHSMALFGGAGVAGRFAFDAGVDLTLRLVIPLPWPLDDIDFNILDVHPRTAFLETVDASHKPANREALVVTDSQNFRKTGAAFKIYKTLGGGNVDGLAHLTQCFASPAPPEKQPKKPEYTPGDPNDLVLNLEMPCNICIGNAEFQYLDVKTQNPLTFELKTMPAYAEKMQPVSDASLPAADKWICGGPLPEPPTIAYAPQKIDPAKVKTAAEANAINKASAEKAGKGFKNAGCYDRCRINDATGALELIQSAKALYAAGIIKDAPNGCY